jgi:hypothetical protein
MAFITGALRDFGLDTLTPFSPRLVFMPSNPSTTKNIIFSTRPVVAVPNGSGNFTVELQDTESIQPAVVYRVRIEWLEAGDADGAGYVGIDLIDWDLHVPASGGAIGDLIQAPANHTLVWVGVNPPPNPPSRGVWWLQVDPNDPDNPAATGELLEWA